MVGEGTCVTSMTGGSGAEETDVTQAGFGVDIRKGGILKNVCFIYLPS